MSQAENSIHYVKALMNKEQTNRALVRYWLYFICLAVFAMVIVGGATRLTDSGLSITEWKPILGIFPPLSEQGWLSEFEKYKLIPEYTQINKGMSLDEFKFIYWWEWGHRFLGRIIGLIFFIPLVYFWASKKLEQKLKPRLLLLLFLGGLQGFIGWWMVSSGLVDRVDVSQYRLAVHLTLACIIFAYALWIARGLSRHTTQLEPSLTLKLFAPIITVLILVQIFLGGLVAGLHAGLAYNTWPLIDGAIIPTGLDVLEPLWRNYFENPKAVQFIHRMSAYFLLVIVLVHWLLVRKSNSEAPHKARAAILMVLCVAQAAIGIVTLVLQVPMFWALVHQGAAIILLGAAVAHWRGVSGTYAPVTSMELRD